MKIILTMAVSVDGKIATMGGSEDFLSDQNWLRFVALANRVGNFVWGRRTYELACDWCEEDFSSVTKIVMAHEPVTLKNGFIQAFSPEDAIEKLVARGFSEMIITGGAILNSEFAKRGLLHEVRLDINPIIIGQGIPLFSPSDLGISMKLISSEIIGDEMVELVYRVRPCMDREQGRTL